MPDTDQRARQRQRKTKAQLLNELETLERQIATLEGASHTGSETADARIQMVEAIEHLAEGVALFDVEDRLVHCNRQYLAEISPELENSFKPGMKFEDLVRIAAEQGFFRMEGRTVHTLIQQRLQARLSGQAWQEMQLANGSWVAFREYEAPGGGTFSIRLNTTPLKHAEEKLRQSEERYRSVSETANDAIISIDGHGAIVSWNRGAEQIFGYSESEVVGGSLERVMPEEFYGKHVAGLKQASGTGQHKYSDKPVELRGLRKNGEEFPVEMSLSHWSVGDSYYFTGIIRDITEKMEAARALQEAKEEAEDLLHRILPEPIVQRVHGAETLIADQFDEATVLFSDLVGFTRISANMAPEHLVQNLNELFGAFDELATELRVEKVKTIGDAYMAVAGVPQPHTDHADAMAHMALGMIDALHRFNENHDPPFQMRVGLQTGPVAAGIIGRHRFLYDIWGDTVNMAARFESYSEPNRIHVTAELARLIEPRFVLEPRGIMNIRGKGEVETFFLNGLR